MRHKLTKWAGMATVLLLAQVAHPSENENPGWQYSWEVGLIPEDRGEKIFAKVGPNGIVLVVDRQRRMNRGRVLVRGTFENVSTKSWQYTFEVRLAAPRKQGFSRGPTIIGSGRYQTPVLRPGELHRWELEMNVTDIADIADGAIGNVVVRDADGKRVQ